MTRQRVQSLCAPQRRRLETYALRPEADVHHFARDHRANLRVLYKVVGKSFGSMPRSRNDRSSGRRWLDTAPAARAAAPKTLIEFIIRRPKPCLFMSSLLAHEDRRLHVLE